jgi:hypothetical protein
MGDGSGGDAKVGIMHILKPYTGFDTNYQGVAADQWIMLQEGAALDPNAGQPGYPAGLVAGLPVVFGSRVSLWLPAIYTQEAQAADTQTYRWHIMWRMRNLQEYRTHRGAYHTATVLGQPDAGQPRVLKPAAYRSFCIQQAEPADPPVASAAAREQFHARPDDVRPYKGNPPAQPINPDGTAATVQSGVLDPAVFGPIQAAMPIYVPIHDVCDGDELLIAVSRDTAPGTATYNFNVGGSDRQFARFMSVVDVGVLVFTGAIPAGENSFA